MSLSPIQVAALLRELEAVDALKTGSVPAHHVDRCLARAGITSTQDQNNALLRFVIDAETGRAGYAKFYPQAAPKPISQQELVYQQMPQLRECFNRFDLGVIGLDQFRNELVARLGFTETTALKDMFRHQAFNITFHHLVQALNREDAPTTAGGTLRIQQPTTNTYSQDRVGVFAGNRADDLSMASNMASKSVKVLGHKPSLTFAEERENQRKGPSTVPGQPLQAAQESPLVYSATASAETTSLLRSQVVLALRRLDEGGLDATRVFLRRLEELQLPLTPTLQRLLDMNRLGNPIQFKEWMRAFEPFFTATLQQQQEQPPASMKAPSPASLQKGFVRAYPPSTAPLNSANVNGRLFGEGLAGPDHHTKRTFDDKSFKTTHRLLETSSPRADLGVNSPMKLKTYQPAERAAARGSDFLCWSEDDQKRPPKVDAVPIRAANTFASSTTNVFQRDAARTVNLVRKTAGGGGDVTRTPFGTEADYAASFSNPAAHTFG